MYKFAFRNLWSRPLRSALSLVGMAVAIVLVIGLVSFSQGIRKLVRESLGQVDGLIVLQKENPDPSFSLIPASLEGPIDEIDGVKVVSPELWTLALQIEGEAAFRHGQEGIKYSAVVIGMDPKKANQIERTAIFKKAIVSGRYLEEGDHGRAVLSKEIADTFKKQVGDSLEAGGHVYEIIGIFSTGSMVFDRMLITDIDTVREISKKKAGYVSSYFVEPDEGREIHEIEKAIEARFPELEAQTPDEVGALASSLMLRLDAFLLVITVLPIVGGAVAILNTMLMSFGERIKEFGVMRACGWTRRDLVGLVLFEASYLGFAGGILGVLAGYAGTALVGLALLVEPVTPTWAPVGCIFLSTLLGMAGGSYPAVKAARMDPIRAIKYE